MSVADAEAPPEASPLWGVVLILAEIACRVERHMREEPAVSGELTAPEDQVGALSAVGEAEGLAA
jgi:hypothetical protein